MFRPNHVYFKDTFKHVPLKVHFQHLINCFVQNMPDLLLKSLNVFNIVVKLDGVNFIYRLGYSRPLFIYFRLFNTGDSR